MTTSDSNLYIVDKFLSDFKKNIGRSLTLYPYECHNLYMILNNIYGEVYESEGTSESKNSYPQNIIDIILGTKLYDINTIPNLEENLNKAYDTLESREKIFVIKRYKEFLTYDELGTKYNLTRERCRQIIQKALRKLRHPSRLRIILGTKDFMDEIKELERTIRNLEERVECSKRLEKMHDDHIEELKKQEKDISLSFLTVSIEELGLSTRSINCLKQLTNGWGREVIVEELVEHSIEDLYKVRNLGKKSIDEIVTKIHSFGLKFKDEDKVNHYDDDDDDERYLTNDWADDELYEDAEE